MKSAYADFEEFTIIIPMQTRTSEPKVVMEKIPPSPRRIVERMTPNTGTKKLNTVTFETGL